MIPGQCPCCGQDVPDINKVKQRDYIKIMRILNDITIEDNYAVAQIIKNKLAKKLSGWKNLYNKPEAKQ